MMPTACGNNRITAKIIPPQVLLIPKIDPLETTAVVVGPPVMYKSVIEEFLKLKIPKNQIQLSLERRMKCGIGKCGHCAIEHLYTCMDGPVFTYWDTLHFRELI